MQLPSVYAHKFQLGRFNSNCLSSHGWRWTLVFWPLSWPVTSSLLDLKYWGWWCGLCPPLRGAGIFLKLLLGYSFAVFAANLVRHQLNAVLLLCSRQQYYPCFRCGWRNDVVHPSTRLALHIWVLSWGWSQAWCSILGYLAPLLCKHWCSCFPSWVEIIIWLMDLFVAGRDQSAADQPNNLAEPIPPL